MNPYTVTYASTGPRGQRLRTLAVAASDDAGAREAARSILALPSLAYARCRILDCTPAQDRPPMT